MWGALIGAAGTALGGWLGSKGSSSGGVKVPSWLSQSTQQLGQFGRSAAQQPYQPYEGNRVAPFSQDTLAAFDLIRNNVGSTSPYYEQAMQTAQRLQNTQIYPQTVNAQNVQTQFDPRNATAAQFANTDLSPYLNPYTNEVVDASLADLENQRAEQYNGLASAAQAAGAFGGSRFGVAQGQFEADALRDKGALSAQLRNQGFNTAANLAMQDIGYQNQFGLANQAAGQFADQLGMQGQLANQGVGMQAQLANQQAHLYGQTQTADVQNRNAFLQGILAQNYGAQQSQDASNLGAIGSTQQAQNQQGLDASYQNYLMQQAYPDTQISRWSQSLNPGIGTLAGSPTQTGGGLLGALGGAQLGGQVASGIYDWWKGTQPAWNQQPGFDPYDSYNDWQG